MAADWSKLKVVDLKAELKRRGLPQAGRKEELINRLTEDDVAQPAPEAATQEATNNEPAQPKAPPEPAIEAQAEAVIPPLAETAPVDDVARPPPPGSSVLMQETTAKSPPITNLEPPATVTPAQASPPREVVTSEVATVPSSEVLQDVQKRKRRSASPPPTTQDIRKRLRTDDEPPTSSLEVGTLGVSQLSKVNGAMEDHQSNALASAAKDAVFGDQEQVDYGADSPIPSFRQQTALEPPREQLDEKHVHASQPWETRSADRYPPEVDADAMVVDERDVEPALHHPTPALYIKNFMRPLREPMVEQHLIELATPSGRSPDVSVIVDFYLDPIRTHAFVHFETTAAAARVRAALHNQVWPDERNRKALWVDYIPPDKIKEWIEKEQSGGGGGRNTMNKWEVAYERVGDTTEATLQEPGAETRLARPPAPPAPQSAAPTGPSRQFPGIEAAPSGPKGFVHPSRIGHMGLRSNGPEDQQGSVRTTRAVPPLTYQPVQKDLASRRIDRIQALASKDSNRDYGREKNRYTFEDGDSFVDRGPEMFEGIRPPHRDRERQGGGRPGGRGGRPFRPPRDRFGGPPSRRDDYRPPPRFNDFRSDGPPRGNFRLDGPPRGSYRDRR